MPSIVSTVPSLSETTTTRKFMKKFTPRRQASTVTALSSSDSDENSPSASSSYRHQTYLYSSDEDGAESESCDSPRQYHSQAKKRSKMPNGRHWSGEISARSNQDNQREFEERAMKQVVAIVEKKLMTGSMASQQSPTGPSYSGGMFYKLEAEWRAKCIGQKKKTNT